MNGKVSTLFSLGISLAVIAGGIWFLSNHHNFFLYGGDQWHMPHRMWSGGVTMVGIVILFWIMAVAAVALVISGVAAAYHDSGRHREDKEAGMPEKLNDPILQAKPETTVRRDPAWEKRSKKVECGFTAIKKRAL